MKKTNPMLLIDFYKAVHSDMLPEKIEKSVSYFTPRMSRVKMWDTVVMFGLQAFVKTYLIDYFKEEFFDKKLDEVVEEYDRILGAALGKEAYKIEKIVKLHKLGYLRRIIKRKAPSSAGFNRGLQTFLSPKRKIPQRSFP